MKAPTLDLLALGGGVAFFGLLAVALFGARLAPHEPIYFVLEHGKDPRPYDPGLVFPFGSDVLGRDLFSLVLAGARATLTIVLLAGLSRVLAGLIVAAVGSWWRPLAVATEMVADFASAVPATLVALVLVKVFVKTADTSVAVFIGALLVTGWAGPYRVVRVELDRLNHARFTEGAAAIGVGRWRLLWRHMLPHLVPTLAMNLSQQIVASLVLLAELGVVGVFVGSTRQISVEESLTNVINGIVNVFQISDPPEWGGLLASARTIESLWTTRWLILVPGVAFAVTAVAVAVIGLAIARRYAQRDVVADLRSRGAALIGLSIVAVFVCASLVPPRYADAIPWAGQARQAIASTSDTAREFAAAGVVPLAGSYAIRRDTASVVQKEGATVSAGGFSIAEPWPRNVTGTTVKVDVRSFVTSGTGGGAVDAPVVFAGRGIVPAEYPPPANVTLFGGKLPELGESIKDYPDDYAHIDVRGKVVFLVKFFGLGPKIVSPNTLINPPTIAPEEAISGAIKRGAAAVVFIDPDLPRYSYQVTAFRPGLLPYARAEEAAPPTSVGGVPVVLLSAKAGAGFAAAVGVSISDLMGQDRPGAYANATSIARETGVSARVVVPLQNQAASVVTVAGEVGGIPTSSGHVLVWSIRQPGQSSAGSDVLAALARTLAPRRAPFIFVDFDDSLEPKANTQLVREAIGDRHIVLAIVLRKLSGTALKFTTQYGDLIPAIDDYAAQAGARFVVTQTTAPIGALDGIAPYADVKSVLVEGTGDGDNDLRPDAAALLAYLAGRMSLGAEELRR